MTRVVKLQAIFNGKMSIKPSWRHFQLVLLIGCGNVLRLSDCLVLNAINGRTFSPNASAEFECIIVPYTFSQTWYVDSISVADCGLSICSENATNPARYSFTPNTSAGNFIFKIDPISLEDNDNVIRCFDGTDFKETSISVTDTVTTTTTSKTVNEGGGVGGGGGSLWWIPVVIIFSFIVAIGIGIFVAWIIWTILKIKKRKQKGQNDLWQNDNSQIDRRAASQNQNAGDNWEPGEDTTMSIVAWSNQDSSNQTDVSQIDERAAAQNQIQNVEGNGKPGEDTTMSIVAGSNQDSSNQTDGQRKKRKKEKGISNKNNIRQHDNRSNS